MDTTVENITSKKDQFIASIDGTIAGASTLSTSHVVASIVESAKESLASLSFPTTRTEAWKYTRVGKIINQKFEVKPTETQVEIGTYHIPGIQAIEMVFVNGFFRADLSETLENNVISVLPMSEAVSKYPEMVKQYYGTIANDKKDIFTALNTSYSTDGLFIHVKGEYKDTAIHLIHINDSDQVIAQCRNLIITEPNSHAKIVTSYHSKKDISSFCNQVTEVVVKENSFLSIDKIQQESEQAFHISNDFVTQEKDSTFHLNTFTLTGGWIRNNLHVHAKGNGTNTDMYGLYQPILKQHIDNHTLMIHDGTDGESNELYKGILYDKGKAVFNGKVIVAIDAQRTNAYQTNANVLLSDDASVNSKPELEIYADDVKCSHGSTTGQFDEEALFYLMARGIKKDTAKRLLTEAFLKEVVDHSDILAVRELVLRYLH